MRELKPIEPLPPMQRDMDILANRLPSTSELAGESITLRFEDDSTMQMAFSATHVRWRATGLGAGDDPYDAVEMRPGIFFLDFSLAGGTMAFSHVLDREHGRALTVWSRITEAGAREPRGSQTDSRGQVKERRETAKDLKGQIGPATIVGRPATGDAIAETRELLGKRLFCEYGPEAALEHIYVNSATLVWQWLRSPPELALEVGIEAVSMWKIRERLYLLAARGPDPIHLILLLDLERMRNVGRLFGHGRLGPVDRRCGAKITFLGEFAYPSGYHPG